MQAEEVDGLSFAQPLRRYANSVGTDTKLGYRGTLINGELKAGSNIGNAPEVRSSYHLVLIHSIHIAILAGKISIVPLQKAACLE